MKAINITRQLFIFLLILNLFSSSIAFAQKGRGTAAAQNKSAAAAKCSGAWTGTISYSRIQSMTDSKTVERVSGRGQDKTNWEMKYDYKAAVAVVEAPEKNGSSNGIATINHNFTSSETVVGKEKNSCDRGKSWQEMIGTSTAKTQITAQGKESANVNVGINSDGTYTVSVGLPQIQGQTTGLTSSTFSGQCTPKEGKSFNLPPTSTSVDGNSLTSDGSNRINPDDPNRLSGSYSKTWQNVTETITWNLQKCGAPLRLTDLKFEHPKFPDFGNWQEIIEQTGTIDGNMVKVKAKVLNASGETKSAVVKLSETYKGDKWDGARPDAPLGEGEMEVTLDPGEEKEVEMVWDSSGYAWFDDGRPRLVQRIKADLEESGKKVDSMTKNLKVAPKPIVLLHGLWEDYRVWEPLYQNLLTTTHSYDWKAYAVGKNAHYGVLGLGGIFGDSLNLFDNADRLARYVKYTQEETNAWHVDMVAHSIGGLVARVYVQKQPAVPDGRPQVKHLVMLGTPNNGAACVDVFAGKFGLFKKELNAARELTNENMAEFNRHIVNTGGTKFSALAGNPVPIICGGVEWNDGIVTVKSAKYGVPETGETNDLSNQMLSTKNFNNFVKPHLITGPKGTYPVAVRNDPTDWRRWQMHGSTVNGDFGSYQGASREDLYRMVSYAREAGTPVGEVSQPFSGEVTLAPKQVTEIEVPVDAALNFGVTFMASPTVTVSLIDGNGAVLRKDLAGSEFSAMMFRMLFVNKTVTKGTWKLRLENTSELEQKFAGFSWSLSTVPGPGKGEPIAE